MEGNVERTQGGGLVAGAVHFSHPLVSPARGQQPVESRTGAEAGRAQDKTDPALEQLFCHLAISECNKEADIDDELWKANCKYLKNQGSRRQAEGISAYTVKSSPGFGTYGAHVNALMDISELAFSNTPSQLYPLPLNLIVSGCKTGSAHQNPSTATPMWKWHYTVHFMNIRVTMSTVAHLSMKTLSTQWNSLKQHFQRNSCL